MTKVKTLVQLFFTTFFLLTNLNLSFGQQEYIADVQYYSVEEGLSHRDVFSTFQDSRGFIWVCTKYGLNRFNGRQFQTFTAEKDGLASNTVSKVVEDAEGWLWVIRERNRYHNLDIASISFINIYTLEVQTIEERFGADNILLQEELFSILADGQKNIFLGTKKGNLLRFHLKKGFSTHSISQVKESIRLLCFIKGNQLLLSEHNKGRNKSKYIIELDEDYNVKWKITSEKRMLFEDNDKRVWFFGNLDGKNDLSKLEFFTLKNRQMEAVDNHFPNRSITLGSRDIRYNTKTDNFWYFDNKNLLVFHTDRGVFYDFNITHPEIGNSEVHHAYFDNQDNVWIGTAFGLFKVKLRKNPFQKLLSLPIQDYNLTDAKSCRGIYASDNQVWINTVKKGVYQVNLDNHQTEKILAIHVKNNRKSTRIKDKATYRDIIRFDEEHVLFGTRAFVIYNIVTKNHQIIYPEEKEHMPNTWKLWKDNDGKIWGGIENNGLLHWNANTDSLIYWKGNNESLFFKTNASYTFLELDRNHVFIGSDKGMFLFHREKGILKRYWRKGEVGYQLPVNSIYHLVFDKDESNIIWAASGGGGLLKLQLNKDNFEVKVLQQFTIIDGLPSNVIYAVYEDEQAQLWMPSDNGIIQFNKKTADLKYYTELNGITHNEFNRLSHFQDKNGMLYFGGLNGVTVFHPKNFSSKSFNSDFPFEITNYQQYNSKQGKFIDQTAALTQNRKIVLTPKNKFFTLEFALLEYQNPSQVKYGYQLVGQSDEWVSLDDNRLRISGLPSGRYTLNIRGQGADGRFSANQLSIPIIVKAPIYLRWWFLLLTLVLLITGIHFFLQWRKSVIAINERKLQEEVNERTATIAQQAEELKNLDNLKSKFFANISHELRTPLTLMLAPIENSLKRKQIPNKDYTNLLLAQRNGQRLNKMISEILDLTKLEARKLEVQSEKVVWYVFLRNTIANFESLANRKNIQFTFEYDGDEYLQIETDVKKLEIVLVNLLSNAFKFTPAKGKVTVNTKNESSHLVIQVSDTGRGIHLDDLPHIFNRFYQSKQKTVAEGGTGIGLALSKEFVQLLNGTLDVKSELSHGTTFTLKIPRVEVISQIETQAVEEIQTLKEEQQAIDTVLPINETVYDKPNQGQSTILLVEDNYDLRDFVQSLLSEKYQVITAENGQSALNCLLKTANLPAKARQAGCQLIISDVMMPVMDGYQLLEQLKSNNQFRHIPVIMLTARGGLDDKLKALRIGVDDYMLKPFNEEELFVRIENLIKNASSRQVAIEEWEETEEAVVEATISEKDQQWLEELEEYVKQQITSFDFSVSVLAQHLTTNRWQLNARIKALTGLTAQQYIQEVRLNQGKILLENQRVTTVKAAALAVGLKSSKYFSSQFKARFGKSPAAYIDK